MLQTGEIAFNEDGEIVETKEEQEEDSEAMKL